MIALPEVRGKLLRNEPLAPYTWFRVGGAAEALFIPADAEDLADFLKALDPATLTNVGGSQAHTNMQPYLPLNFCIALQGIFPSQN